MKCHKPLIAAIFLLATIPALAQYTLSPPPRMQFLDNNGQILAGGLLYSYQAGTTNPLATYSSSLGTVNTNPIVLDSAGYADLWLQNNTAYKLCLSDSNNVQMWCIDNVKTSVISQASDITSLFTGPCTPATFLRGDGACVTPLGGGNLSVTGSLTQGRFPYATGPTTLADGPLISQPLVSSPLGSNLNFLEVTLSPWVGVFDMGSGTLGGIVWEVTDGSGTTQGGYLYKINSIGKAVLAATTDTVTPVYVALGDNNGFAQLFMAGASFCIFDGPQVIGHYVSASTTSAGKCHDAGSSPPSNTFLVGISTSSAGQVSLFPSLNTNPGGLADPGGNGIVKRTALNTTAVATSSDIAQPFGCGSPSTQALYGDGTCKTPSGAGNVSTTGLTTNRIPLANTSTSLTDSALQQVANDGSEPGYVEFHSTAVPPVAGLLNFRGVVPQGDLTSAQVILTSVLALYHLVKLNASGQWTPAGLSDTNTLVLPAMQVSSDTGGSPTWVVQMSGQAWIDVDNGTGCTPGDVVDVSTIHPGEVHDTGAVTPPTGVFIVGTCISGGEPSLIFLTPSFH